MKGRSPKAVGEGLQIPLPRVELGCSDHQLKEFQRCREETGDHGRSDSANRVEEFIDCVGVGEFVDVVRGFGPPLVK